VGTPEAVPEVVEEWPLTALLRAARSVLGAEIRRALAVGGYDDLPPDGPYVIGWMARTSAPLGDIIMQLGVSKQAAGQLVDAWWCAAIWTAASIPVTGGGCWYGSPSAAPPPRKSSG